MLYILFINIIYIYILLRSNNFLNAATISAGKGPPWHSLPWHLAYHEPQPTPSPPDASQGTPPPPPPPLFRGDPAGRLAWVDVVTAAGGSGPGQEALWDALHGRALPPLPSGPMPPDGHRGPG